MAEPEHAVGPEAVHLPAPSIWPAVMAVGIALTLTGLIIGPALRLAGVKIPLVFVLGVLISVASVLSWVRGARREYRGLPAE